MRALALAIFVIGCRHDDPPAREAPPLAPHVESIAARPTPADAPATDAVDPDAAGGDSPDPGILAAMGADPALAENDRGNGTGRFGSCGMRQPIEHAA